MLVVGLLVSSLAARVRDVAEMALQREQRTQALYALSRELSGLRDPREVAAGGGPPREPASSAARPRCCCRGRRRSSQSATRSRRTSTSPNERAVAQLVVRARARRPAPRPTRCRPRSPSTSRSSGSRGPLGVLAVELPASARPLSPEQRELLSVARAAGRGAPRARAPRRRGGAGARRRRGGEAAQHAAELRVPRPAHAARRDHRRRERAARGPAAGAAARRELASTVLDEAERLNRLVRNLLDMTRLESGTLAAEAGMALARGGRRLGARPRGALRRRGAPGRARRPRAAARRDRRRARRAGARQPARERRPPRRRDGRIEVGARREGAVAVVEVCDEGPGFPAGGGRAALREVPPRGRRPGRGPRARDRAGDRRPRTAARSRRALREPRGACFRFTLPLGGAARGAAARRTRAVSARAARRAAASRSCSSSRTSRSWCASCAPRCRRTATR